MKLGNHGTQTTLSEINVTPLVDVMLVLLIVFMISAPLMQQGVQVDLPKANAGTLNEVPDHITIQITRSKAIEINGKPVEKGGLYKKLLSFSSAKPNIQVYVKADQAVPYGFIAQVIAVAKRAKVHRVGLVTQPSGNDVNI